MKGRTKLTLLLLALCSSAFSAQESKTVVVHPGDVLHFQVSFKPGSGTDGVFQSMNATLSTQTPLRADQFGFERSFKGPMAGTELDEAIVFFVKITIPEFAADGDYDVSFTAYGSDPNFKIVYDASTGVTLPTIRVENRLTFQRPEIVVVRKKTTQLADPIH
ncbi:MAG TPA: hypothetical protein VLZ50_03925 [Terracidiphilus sp.]|nr:hypothetical protein [Terracidiphilus sp.]